MMNKIERYSRQVQYHRIGSTGQKKIENSSIVIVGAGALGSVNAELAVRAGIGKIKIIDFDILDLSNLQRQAVYDESDVGKLKVKALTKKLKKINSNLKIIPLAVKLTSENVNLLKEDVVIDCTDNMNARFLINEYCVKEKISWVHASAEQDIAQLCVFTPNNRCFNCLFEGREKLVNCDTEGVLNSTTHLVASLGFKEVIKLILGEEPEKDLLRINVWNNNILRISTKKKSSCNVCKGEYKLLENPKIGNNSSKNKTENKLNEEIKFKVDYCKTKAAISSKLDKPKKLNLNKIKEKYETVIDTPILLVIKTKEGEVVVHGHGELLFKESKNKEKIKKISKELYMLSL